MRLIKAFILAILIIAIVVGLQAILNCLPLTWRGIVIVVLFAWMVFKIKDDVFTDKNR